MLIIGDNAQPALGEAHQLFERLWNNEEGRTYSVDYSAYGDPSRLRYLLYWFMETTGISTF
ncbi:MAG TPA: hypothetical protein DCM54_08775 [Gammaproteobacteria bacterium]|nr:hypothetical protein [Gammaproteobacteria bacterium]HAK51978.1 hypothetical protein [Gammaproteobacteria bacterium]